MSRSSGRVGSRFGVGSTVTVLLAAAAMILALLTALPASPAAAAAAAGNRAAAAPPSGSSRPANDSGMATSPVSSVAGSVSQPPSAADRAVTDAKAQAKATGRPVHVAAADDETTTTYANPDGTMTTDVSSGPIRVLRGGAWQNVDATLVSTGGAVSPRAVEPLVSFSGGGSAAPLATFADAAGHSVSLRWPGSLPVPVLSGPSATYPNVLPGTDLVLTANRLGIEVSLLLHSRPAVPVVLRLPMTLGGGLRVTQTANGDLQLLDAAGTLVAYSPAPTMYGAGIGPHSGLPTQRSAIPSTIVQAPAGPELDLSPDMGFLSDPGMVYPVTVDPSTSLSLDVDTFLQSGYPNSTDGASQTDLRVGTYDGGGNYDQSYVQFHAGPIKGKTVTAATLHLWEFHSWSCTPGEFRVYQSGEVSASSTWNSRPPAYQKWYDGSFAYGNSSSCPGRDVPINLAAAAQFWAGDGYSETETLLLAAGSGSDNNQYKKFSSSRGYVPPSVSVTYNDTTPTAPDGLRTQFTDTLVPKMSGTVHDADNSAMTAYFTVRNAAGTVIGGAGGSQANVPNGAVAGFQIPGTQLIPGQGYTWSMHACANGLCSAETSAVSFRVNPLKGAGALRGHHSTSVSSSAGAKVSVDLASGNASVGVTGFTFAGNAGFSLPVGVRYDSMAVAPGAVPASGTGGAGLGWRFASGPGVSMTITRDKTLDVITPGGAVHDFCCDPGPNYFRNGNYDVDFNKQPEGTYRLVEHASQSEYDFNPAGQLTDQRDRNHNSFHFTYDTGGGLTQIDAQNPAGQVVRSLTVSTDSSHRITGVAQAGDGATPGRSASFRYNSAGYLEQVTDPAGQATALGYDSAGNLTSLATPGGRQVSVGYDSSHRATSLTQRDPNATDATTSFAYSTPSPTTTQTKLYDPDHPTSGGVATTYDADNTGKITRVTDPFGQHTDTTHTPSGNPGGDQVATANSPAAGMTTNTYGANGGESQTQSASSAGTSTAAYTNTGPANKYLPSQVSDPNSVNTNFTYDAPGNQLTSADGSGGANPAATAAVSRNNDGTVANSTDPNNKAAGNQTGYGYDSAGQLTSVTPPSGNPLGARHDTYNALGQLTSSTSGNGVTTTYNYDADGRPTGQSTAGTPTCPAAGSASTVCYSYDADGNVLSRTDAAGTTTFGYDGQGRQASKAVSGAPDAYRLDYTHDPAGNLTAATETVGSTVHTVRYGYNNAELLDTATEGDGSHDLFDYNADHQRTDTWYTAAGTNSAPTYNTGNRWQLSPPAGYSGHIALTVAGGKLTAEKTTTAAGNGAPASDLTYAYSLTGGPCGAVAASADKDSVTDNRTGNTTYYCRDGRGRLVRESTQNSGGGTVSDYRYSYDADGNRLTGPEGTHSYNSANQLTAASYDAAGNQTSPGNIAYNPTDQSTSFNGTSAAYAGADQKERTTLGGNTYADGATGTASITTNGTTTFYDRDPGGTLLGEHGPDGNLSYIFDGHGSVTALLDHTGAVQATYSYDTYGNHPTVAGPNTTAANNNPWRYTSGLQDAGSGLYKFGQRYYQPTLGSWTQQDSVEALANLTDGNRYAYAADNPADNIDPNGTNAFSDFFTKDVPDFLGSQRVANDLYNIYSIATDVSMCYDGALAFGGVGAVAGAAVSGVGAVVGGVVGGIGGCVVGVLAANSQANPGLA